MTIEATSAHSPLAAVPPQARSVSAQPLVLQDILEETQTHRVDHPIAAATRMVPSGPSAPNLCSARPEALLVRAERRNETVGSHTHPVWRVQVPEAPAKHAPNLKTIDATKVFRAGTVFFGFGIPNVYMGIVGDQKTAKVDAKSLYRKPAKIAQTRGNVQSGFFIVPRELPVEAVAAVVKAAQEAEGSRDITCVTTNTRILAKAGFTLNGRGIKHTWPHEFLRRLIAGSLEYKGEKINFDVVRTTPMPLAVFLPTVERAVYLTPLRHMNNACDTIDAIAQRATEAEQVRALPLTRSEPLGREGPHYAMYYSRPSRLGSAMRNLWGAHPIINVSFPLNCEVDNYLPQTLVAFDIKNPSLLTRVKRDVIFCKPIQTFLRHGLAKHHTEPQSFQEGDVVDMLNANQMHNVVLTAEGLKVTSNKVWSGVVDWVLSKHVLLAGKQADVRFAGEMWKTDDDIIHVNRNSGTFRPSPEQLQSAVRLVHDLFPNLHIHAEELSE